MLGRCGGDGRIRRQFLRALTEANLDPTAYCQVTAPLAERQVATTRHGLVGITLGQDGGVAVNVGVRPE